LRQEIVGPHSTEASGLPPQFSSLHYTEDFCQKRRHEGDIGERSAQRSNTMTMPNTEARGSGTEGAGQQSGGSAREQIRGVKDQVVGQARSSLEQARDRASSSLGESKGQFADQFGSIADALRRTTEHLRSNNQEGIAGVTDSIARQIDQVASYLRDKDATAMKTDLENLARRQPGLVMGGALILGLMSARFLKSSQRDRRMRGGSQSYGRQPRYGNGGYNQFSSDADRFSTGADQYSGGTGQIAGGYDQTEDADFQRPSTGRGGYGGSGYAGA
jgi:uncharacterized protein YjbJ (UPF0337 family)